MAERWCEACRSQPSDGGCLCDDCHHAWQWSCEIEDVAYEEPPGSGLAWEAFCLRQRQRSAVPPPLIITQDGEGFAW